jgi:hypothetical protein
MAAALEARTAKASLDPTGMQSCPVDLLCGDQTRRSETGKMVLIGLHAQEHLFPERNAIANERGFREPNIPKLAQDLVLA